MKREKGHIKSKRNPTVLCKDGTATTHSNL